MNTAKSIKPRTLKRLCKALKLPSHVVIANGLSEKDIPKKKVNFKIPFI